MILKHAIHVWCLILGMTTLALVPVETLGDAILPGLHGRIGRASDEAPKITIQPQSTSGLEGESLALSVTATGTAPLSFQWYKEGEPIPGATSDTLEILFLLEADAGTYRVEVSNAFGKTVSADAIISFIPLIQVFVNGSLVSSVVRVSEPASVSLKSARPGWILHYTLDGSEPTPTSPTYTESFVISKNTELRIAADSPDHAEFLEGDSVRFLFLFPQTIDWGDLPEIRYPGSGQVTAMANSGLPVRIRILSGPAILDGSILTATGAGVVLLRAEQDGNETYAAVTSERSLVIGRGIQQVTFPALPDRVLGDPPLQLTASASSGLAVTFEIISGPASLTGNVLSPTGPGRIEVKAVQAGNELWSPAEVVRSFTVAPASTPTLRVLGSGANGSFLLELRAAAAAQGTIVFSPDLRAWTPVAVATGSGMDQPVLVTILVDPDADSRVGFWKWTE